MPGLQEAVFAAVYEWRDRVCREEDEGTGYVLPKAHLIILGQNMPGETLAAPFH
jgi:exosome complex exonuclease RRP6